MAAQVPSSFPELTKAVRDDPDATAHLERLSQRLQYALAKIDKLEEERRLERAERFAASSEQSPQFALFNEAEQEAADDAAPADEEATVKVPAHERKVARRKPLPEDLPHVVVEHDLDERTCGCGTDKVRIGTKKSQQLDVIPAQVFVIEHHRHSYKCPACEDAAPETAPMPAQPIPKSNASPGLLAHVATAKYVDGLPLYRQSAQFERIGVDLPRQTLASHMVRAGELAGPLIERMGEHARNYDVLQMDETRVQVLDEDGRAARSQSWMWVIRGGPPERPVVCFHYDPSRGSTVPVNLLDSFAGYLQTDGYAAYGQVLARESVTGLGCWAHARRRFVKAQQVQPKGKSSAKLQQVLFWIGKLYALEQGWQALDPDARRRARQEQAAPILEKIEQWARKQDVNPQSLLGRAISYLLGEWPRLKVYLDDGRLAIDNNRVENDIRPFALGRKNWLFSQSAAGARSSAALYSLVETARANRLNPYAYLKFIFTALPRASTEADIEALLPWNVDREALEQLLAPPK